MSIIDKIQEKTRQEYIEILKLRAARLSGAIQQQPLQYFFGALAAGFLIAVFFKFFISLALLLLCAAVVVYFIAPEKKVF